MAAAENVEVFWSSAERTADEVLVARIHALLGSAPVLTGRLCPGCGSSGHGRPWARHGEVDVPVSLSRSGPHLLVVVAPGVAAVGVDVEEIASLERSWPDTVLAPGESAVTAAERARVWVAKEAILKAEGVGLARPMSEVRIAEYADRLRFLEAPVGYVAALVIG